MPLKDYAARRAYENERRARHRRTAGVPELSPPDSITAVEPWTTLGVCRGWWYKVYRWTPPECERWRHREKARGG
jgi:hypothetical protein